MKAVIGLGNPGQKYELTRHNAGFIVVDNVLMEAGGDWRRTRWKGLAARTVVDGSPALLGKPQTFMNLSGHFVGKLVNFYKIEPADCLVVHDDLDLPLGRIRLARSGGSAGHKGVESVIRQLGHNDFPRLKVGVGRPEGDNEVVDYVLSGFHSHELDCLSDLVSHCIRAAACWLRSGIEEAMNQYNSVHIKTESAEGG